MKIKEIVAQVEQSEEFKDWREQNKEIYLANLFMMFEQEYTPWQVSYYNKKDDTMTSFTIEKSITMNPGAEVMKSQQQITPLELDSITTSPEEALTIAEGVLKEKYSKNIISKKILVLQQSEVPFWNVTFICSTFNVVNVRMDASTKKIIKDSETNIMKFKEDM